MALTTAMKNDIAAYIAHGTLPAWASDATWYLSLHTASPGVGGSQTTSEATFTSYARQPIARDATGLDVSGAEISNDDLIQFPKCTGGTSDATHFGIGRSLSGAGTLLIFGSLSSTLNIADQIQAQFAANDIDITVVDA